MFPGIELTHESGPSTRKLTPGANLLCQSVLCLLRELWPALIGHGGGETCGSPSASQQNSLKPA